MSTSQSGLQLARAGLAAKTPMFRARLGHGVKKIRSPEQAERREAQRSELQTPRYIHEYQGPGRGEIRGRARLEAGVDGQRGALKGNLRGPDEQPKDMAQVIREAGEVKPASASMWSRMWR